jgi:Rrf2 family transcriptional regulator, cysteine metabolism repressor
MKLITKNTDYAIRALLALAQNMEQYVPSRDIAESSNMPYEFLRKIINQLQQAQYVVSKEGGKGGYKLAVDPQKIVVEEIITLFQGKITLSECMFRGEMCECMSDCVLRDNILKIEEMVVNEFKDLTIGKLIKQMR